MENRTRPPSSGRERGYGSFLVPAQDSSNSISGLERRGKLLQYAFVLTCLLLFVVLYLFSHDELDSIDEETIPGKGDQKDTDVDGSAPPLGRSWGNDWSLTYDFQEVPPGMQSGVGALYYSWTKMSYTVKDINLDGSSLVYTLLQNEKRVFITDTNAVGNTSCYYYDSKRELFPPDFLSNSTSLGPANIRGNLCDGFKFSQSGWGVTHWFTTNIPSLPAPDSDLESAGSSLSAAVGPVDSSAIPDKSTVLQNKIVRRQDSVPTKQGYPMRLYRLTHDDTISLIYDIVSFEVGVHGIPTDAFHVPDKASCSELAPSGADESDMIG